jgi:hypothetical protein
MIYLSSYDMTNKTQKRGVYGGNLQSVVSHLKNIASEKQKDKQNKQIERLRDSLNTRDVDLLISVNKHLEPTTKKTKYDDVPILCILLKFVSDTKLLRSFIKTFVKLDGDLLLESKTHKITALSVALDNEERKIMIQREIDKQYASAPEMSRELKELLDIQKQSHNSTVRTRSSYYTPRSHSRSKSSERLPPKLVEKPSVQQKPPPQPKEQAHLQIHLSLSTMPDGYDPIFWQQIFGNDTWIERLRSLNCNTLTSIFDGFQLYDCVRVNTNGEKYGSYSPEICACINRIMCISFLCLGFLSHRLRESDYTIVFKGGKVVQILYPAAKYKSNDIDIVLVSNRGYEHDKMKSFAAHIGFLLAYISGGILPVSVKTENENSDIVKVSIDHNGFFPFCDIDFGNSPGYLKNNIATRETIGEMNFLFRYPSEKSFITDKLKYFIHYEHMKFLEHTEEYNYLISKFQRGLVAIRDNTKKLDFPKFVLEYIQSHFSENEFVIGVAGHKQITAKIMKMLKPA